jgi:CHAT domain-containing protein/Tfp pilus assembly protein PilF
MTHRRGQHASMGVVLVAWLLAGATVADAAPARQTNSAAQCAEGVQLFLDGKAAKALPLLEAGFTGRTGARSADPDDLGVCALILGQLRDATGNSSGALEADAVALEIFRRSGNRKLEGTSLNNIAAVYEHQGHYSEALEQYQQALVIQREVGDRKGEATTLNNIGLVYGKLGHYSEALAHLHQALVIRREVGDRKGEATTLNNIAGVYQQQGRYSEALEHYQQALLIVRTVGDQSVEGTTLSNVGLVHDKLGHYSEALEHYQQALVIQREIGDQTGEATTLNNIGVVYQQQGNLTQALAQYAQAMDIFEAIRATTGSEQGRAGFIAQYASLYYRAAALYQHQGQDDLAFRITERGRARVFLDSLATGQVQLSDQADQDLLEREQEAYAARQVTQEALAKARAARPLDPAVVADLEQQLTYAQRAYQDAQAMIDARGDQLAALVPGRTKGILDRAAVQTQLDSQTTLVSFFGTNDQTFVFVLRHDLFQTVALPIGHDALYDQVRALLDSPGFEQIGHSPEAVALYNALITPLKPYLVTPYLTIIPHGPLHYLPFAALSDGQRYLIDDYIISTLPSASVLPFIQANTGHPLTAPLILGNPDGTLRFAEQEARAVARLYGVQPLIGVQATKDALQKRVREAGIVHLATHAVFDPNVPLASNIILAPNVTNTVHLEASEVYALDLHKADLVVLSACQTNLGDVSAGDEVVGLTRAFFFAGTPTVISSLWSVDDAASGLLMERFYTHLQAGMGKAEALRQAQIDVRAQYPAPYYWAGFVLAGDAGRVSEPDMNVWWWLGGALALLMIGLACMLNLLYQRVMRRGPGT